MITYCFPLFFLRNVDSTSNCPSQLQWVVTSIIPFINWKEHTQKKKEKEKKKNSAKSDGGFSFITLRNHAPSPSSIIHNLSTSLQFVLTPQYSKKNLSQYCYLKLPGSTGYVHPYKFHDLFFFLVNCSCIS